VLIAIEGIDGSGKGTQSQILFQKLKELKVNVELFSFPFYEETFFGREVGRYLNGEYGTLENVPVEFASLLYAGDRFEKKQALLSVLKNDGVAICDRYVPSNLAHQAAKLHEENQQASLMKWISTLEYEVYNLPMPDLVLFLDMRILRSKELVLQKNKRAYTDKKLDIHESASDYLSNVYRIYKELAQKEHWIIIPCCNGDKLRSISEISNQIYDVVSSKIKA
jgi:dTMP kinase